MPGNGQGIRIPAQFGLEGGNFIVQRLAPGVPGNEVGDLCFGAFGVAEDLFNRRSVFLLETGNQFEALFDL